MTASVTRIDVRAELVDEHFKRYEGEIAGYYWVLQTTLPVTDRFRSCQTFPTRAAAVLDFEATAADMGWELNDG